MAVVARIIASGVYFSKKRKSIVQIFIMRKESLKNVMLLSAKWQTLNMQSEYFERRIIFLKKTRRSELTVCKMDVYLFKELIDSRCC